MKVLYKIYLLCICVVFVTRSQAQQANISVDTTSAMIGEPIVLDIKVSSKSELNWPGWEKGVSGFEVLEVGELKSKKSGDEIVYMQSLRLTQFDVGSFKLGPIGFLSGSDSIFTKAIKIDYSTVKLESEEIYDIQDPVEEPFTIDEFVKEILIAFGILIFIVLAFYFIFKRKKKPQKIVEPKRKKQEVHIWALAALKELKSQELWQKGEVKAYYVRLTDIFREYTEARYGILALESTTDEIINDLKQKAVDSALIIQMEEILRVADMVKFAKSTPLGMENDKYLNDIIDFVERTKTTSNNE